MEEIDIDSLTYGYLLLYLGPCLLMSIWSGWKRGFFVVSYPLINSQISVPIASENSCLD